MKSVLCLGAGLVARPYIHYMCTHGFNIIVASRTIEKANHLIEGCEHAEAIALNITKDDVLLEELVSRANLVCSLLPNTLHVKAAKVAIAHKKPFCTTSYISKEMQALDREAREAGILLLNECGVDPGIDHMSAMKVIDHVHNNHGKIISFTSFTGGLPAPDANDNPFGYKLSWSPRGVLLASRSDAHFLKDGDHIDIPGPDLFDNYEIMQVPGAGKFEGYPNRDSLSYIDIYNIPETKTMLRGTLRNIGWCPTLKKIADLGLLDTKEHSLRGLTFTQMVHSLVSSKDDTVDAVSQYLNLRHDDPIIHRLAWLGIFSDEEIPEGINTYLDALCYLFEKKLQYAPGERDMLVMYHSFLAEYPDHQEKVTSSLIDYGISHGDSSMSRTVALPVAIASRMILEGTIRVVGVHRPIIPEIYEPVLQELETLGIRFDEKTMVMS